MQNKGRINRLIRENWIKVWYMFCFFMLGVIDQRRGSAIGRTQMVFSNLTGIVIALMLVPSLNLRRFQDKSYAIWTPFCAVGTAIACGVGVEYWDYTGQWISGVFNFTVWSYLIIYIVKNWKNLESWKRCRQPFFWCIAIILILMQISNHGGILGIWYFMIFGGFYLIGIPQKNRRFFFQGMLNGIIAWFFIQQVIAFGLRPYDHVRYRGLYSGETQNGLFYMIIYCTFLIKWMWAKKEKKHKFLILFYFVMSASSITFMLYTGGKAPLLGAVVATATFFIWYDTKSKKLYSCMKNIIALILCVIILIPVVYACIRYLPTVLHHPIWFEGEYVEGYSVCSFDAWNSPKYVSFEKAVETNIGRILKVLGIDFDLKKRSITTAFSGLKVHAAEVSLDSEPGSSRDRPYTDSLNQGGILGIRKDIYEYYWRAMNIRGHKSEQAGFYITKSVYIPHSHNLFLQIAYDYGIFAGISFMVLYLYCILQAMWRHKPVNAVCVTFLLAIGCFGFAETVWIPGQITVALMWILFYFVGEDSWSIGRRSVKYK